jgi:hypothetical protein
MSHPFLDTPAPLMPGPNEDLANVSTTSHTATVHVWPLDESEVNDSTNADEIARANDNVTMSDPAWSGDDNDGLNRDESHNSPPDHNHDRG